MPKGGSRPGAGRKSGSRNKATIESVERLTALAPYRRPVDSSWIPIECSESPSRGTEFNGEKSSDAPAWSSSLLVRGYVHVV